VAGDRNHSSRLAVSVEGARQSTLRKTNLGAVARLVLASDPPVTRVRVASALNMARSTASRLVDELVDGRVVVELDAPDPSGRGRPATPLVANSRVAALGLQVNTTFLVARLINLQGHVIAERRVEGDFRSSRPGRVLRRLDRLMARVLGDAAADVEVVGVGLALPGLVDARAGRLLIAPNLGWADVRPADHLAIPESFSLHLGNEADMAARAVAEASPGRPSGLRDFIFLSGETGIGASTVSGGEILGGRHGWAGEIGHMCVHPEGPPCPCGSHGCLELYAGRKAIIAAAGLDEGSDDSERLSTLFDQGRTEAVRAVEQAGAALATALVGAVNLLDVHVIVLGGHLGEIGRLLKGSLEDELGARVLSARWMAPRVESRDDDDALACRGAAFVPLTSLVEDPGAWIARQQDARADRSPGG
jgi:predicted NBD/HSP70 family sugar kinase